MSQELKLCRNCVYCYKPTWRCHRRPRLISLVNGEHTYRTCNDARGDNPTENCGRDGKYFVRRLTIWKKLQARWSLGK